MLMSDNWLNIKRQSECFWIIDCQRQPDVMCRESGAIRGTYADVIIHGISPCSITGGVTLSFW